MICEACGDDGLIEVDAYRGGHDVDTRECHLCGGVITELPQQPETPPTVSMQPSALQQPDALTENMFGVLGYYQDGALLSLHVRVVLSWSFLFTDL